MNHPNDKIDAAVVDIFNADAQSSLVLVCEHASAFIPPEFDHLGIPPDIRASHIAWDPGALGVAECMASELDAILVAAKTSRLVYDCNRAPDAPDAMPVRSEIHDVPGNCDLSDAQKSDRIARFYMPFCAAIERTLAQKTTPILLTIHSFTPVYHNRRRDLEVGVLYDTDTRLADALMDAICPELPYVVRRNEPYGPEHNVMHTLTRHATPGGHLNAMLEIRNDLIQDAPAQQRMGQNLAAWVQRSLPETGVRPC